eukprot:279229_1
MFHIVLNKWDLLRKTNVKLLMNNKQIQRKWENWEKDETKQHKKSAELQFQYQCISQYIQLSTLTQLPSDILTHCTQYLLLPEIMILELTCIFFNIQCKNSNTCYYIDFGCDSETTDNDFTDNRWSGVKELSVIVDDEDSFTTPMLSTINQAWLNNVETLYLNCWHQDFLLDFEFLVFNSLKNIYIGGLGRRFPFFIMQSFIPSRLEKLMIPISENYDAQIVCKYILNAKALQYLQIHSSWSPNKQTESEVRKLIAQQKQDMVRHRYKAMELIEYYDKYRDESNKLHSATTCLYELFRYLIDSNDINLRHLSLEWVKSRGSFNIDWALASINIDNLICYDVLSKLQTLKLSGESNGILLCLNRIVNIIMNSTDKDVINLQKIEIEPNPISAANKLISCYKEKLGNVTIVQYQVIDQ